VNEARPSRFATQPFFSCNISSFSFPNNVIIPHNDQTLHQKLYATGKTSGDCKVCGPHKVFGEVFRWVDSQAVCQSHY
jgi:hypothetical protein